MKKTLTGLAFVAVLMTGCTGTFALTNELYQFHRDQERWVDEALFLVFAITPIYGTAILADAVVLNSIDTDGVKRGFDLEMLAAVCDAVSVPVIASGGAGGIRDFITLFKALPKVDAGLAASIFHFGEVRIPDLKRELRDNGIIVRL